MSLTGLTQLIHHCYGHPSTRQGLSLFMFVSVVGVTLALAGWITLMLMLVR